MGLKVCQLCAVDFTLDKFLLPLIDGMTSKGWDVVAVCSPGKSVEPLRARGYRIETVPISRSLNPLLALRSLWALMELFRKERFDVLHAHTPVAALIGRLAARLLGIPFVIYTAHGFYFHDGMPAWKYRLFVSLEQLAGFWTHLLFTQSTEDASTAVAEKIMPSENVLAIGNGVDVQRFSPVSNEAIQRVRTSLGIPEDAYVIGLIGRQVREKGIVEFLQAARSLADAHTNLWFLLVGERLPSDHATGVSEELTAARTALGVRLILTGLRDDIPALLAAMDLFCLPSWREGMPRTIIEAMMMGKPVLATDIRGAREEVVPEETGLLVPIRSPDALAVAMARFIENPAWGKQLGSAGRVRAIALYDESQIVQIQLDRIDNEVHTRGAL